MSYYANREMKWLKWLITFIFCTFLAISSSANAQSSHQCFQTLDSGKYADGERCFQSLVNQNPTNARFHYYLAQALRKHGTQIGDEQRLQQALKHYREAVRIDKNYAWALNGLGNLHHVLSWNADNIDDENDNLKESEKAYQAVLKVPDQPGPPTTAHTSAHVNLAAILSDKGKFPEALDEIQKALQLDPRYGGAYEQWGDILYEMSSLDLRSGQRDLIVPAQQRLQTAIKRYREAIRLNPELAESYLGAGRSLMLLGEYQEAIRQFQAAAQKGPYDLAYVYIRWGDALEALGDLNGAINRYQTATQVKSLTAKTKIAFAYVRWGDALAEQAREISDAERMQKWAEALGRFQQALDHPNDLKESEKSGEPSTHAVAQNNMGLIYWQQNNLEQAEQHFKEAISISPTFRVARSNEKEVHRQIQLRTRRPIELTSPPFPPLDEQTATKRSLVRIISRFWTDGGIEEGTGWIVESPGNKALIVTNHHVVVKNRDADEIEIELYYGNVPEGVLLPRVPAQIFQRSPNRNDVDLALVESESFVFPKDVQQLPVVNQSIQQGSPISVVGNSNFQWVNGSLSQISTTDLILTPKLEPGYSGSPVLDSQNRVVGLVYAIDSSANRPVSYAHPLTLVIPKLQEWRRKQ
ncbi:MAG TPA: tetratricopeptide repeat protein [Stenomitos sp.]